MTKISATNLLYNYRQAYCKDNHNADASKQDNKIKNKTNYKSAVIPISLLTVGGLLLYLGYRMPNENKMWKNLISQRVNEIDSGFDSIPKILKNCFQNISNDLGQLVSSVLDKRRLDIKTYQQSLDKASDNQMLKDSMESAIQHVSLSEYSIFNEKGYLSLADELDIRYSKIKDKYRSNFENDKTTVENEMKDKATISFKDEKLVPEDVLDIQKKLKNYADIKIKHLEDNLTLSFEQHNISDYRILLDMIVKLRKQKYEDLEEILQLAKEKANIPILKTEDSIKIAKSKIKTISKEDLKPISEEQLDEEYLAKNRFVKLLSNIDFNKVSNKNIDDLYAHLDRDINIKDLQFLFKKIEFYRQLSEKENKPNAKILENLNIKLAYIIDELTQKGETDFLNRIKGMNFDGIRKEKLEGNLVAVNNISKRLGFSSFKELDAFMTNKYKEYQQTSFHKLMENYIVTSKFFMF